MSAPESKPPTLAAPLPSAAVPEYFVDGVAHIGVAGGVVRIDFAHLAARVDGPDQLEHNVRIVASVEGFVATYRTMQRMVERLAALGKIAVVAGPELPVDAKVTASARAARGGPATAQ